MGVSLAHVSFGNPQEIRTCGFGFNFNTPENNKFGATRSNLWSSRAANVQGMKRTGRRNRTRTPAGSSTVTLPLLQVSYDEKAC